MRPAKSSQVEDEAVCAGLCSAEDCTGYTWEGPSSTCGLFTGAIRFDVQPDSGGLPFFCKKKSHAWIRLKKSCQNVKHIGGTMQVNSVEECKILCALHMGYRECGAIKTDGQRCRLKANCEGEADTSTDECSGMCAYRVDPI